MPSRDEEICARFLDGISATRISMETGLSAVRVQQILKAGGAIGKPRKAKAEGVSDLISDDHALVGKKLSLYRMSHLGVTRGFLAEKMGWSAVKLSYVENATFNLTLLDLQAIAKLMKIGVNQLLEREIE